MKIFQLRLLFRKPLELYFFSASTAWISYEKLQAEVFEHVIAKLHMFDLEIFQNPTGLDFQKMKQN